MRKVLSQRTRSYLNPNPELSQFQRSRSLTDGLQQAIDAWKLNFQITKRGLRRATWTLEPGNVSARFQLRTNRPRSHLVLLLKILIRLDSLPHQKELIHLLTEQDLSNSQEKERPVGTLVRSSSVLSFAPSALRLAWSAPCSHCLSL